MSIFRITPDELETFTIVANPYREFASSSFGYTGSIYLFARRSDIEKETEHLSSFLERQFVDDSLDVSIKNISFAEQNRTNIQAYVEQYLKLVNSSSVSARKNKQLNIFRFVPTTTFEDETLKKNVVRKTLNSYYRVSCPDNHWAYTNYHCINFFTASGLPNDSVLLYPNSASLSNSSNVSGAYVPTKDFTFEFYINPKYTTDSPGGSFKDGTILHLSSTYSISLVSGTLKDSAGFLNGYRIKLQLSHSADIIPSLASAGSYPNNLIFTSTDNSLRRNHWHHVAIRWGTNNRNNGTGSIYIDGILNTNFVVPSSSIAPAPFVLPRANPDVLCVGNFYEGNNQGTSAQSVFFNNAVAQRDGLVNLNPSSETHSPASFSFNHPLNAEIHDLRIYNSYRTDSEISNDMLVGPSNLNGLLFYLPPFFTKESPIRKVINSNGGILQTPFQGLDGTTDDPFNVALSFGVDGHYLNLENFLRDIKTGNYPRQWMLTGSQINSSSDVLTANQFLYATSSIRKRNITLLPCDNGKFIPNFDLLISGTYEKVPSSGSNLSKYVNDFGNLNLSLISLNDMVLTSSLFSGITNQSGSIFDGLAGATPEDPGIAPGQVLSIFQRTRDNSSNEVVFFEISNLFYGNRIKPGSFSITDTNISGSGNKLGITIKDNGYGSLYRSDCLTSQAYWNSIGNIYYNEGIVLIKTPNIPFFGQDQHEMSFNGESTIHVLKVLAEAGAGLVNSSSNNNYELLSASLNANDTDPAFVYITNIDWLDDNLNVVMKTNLAQPIKKRSSDKFVILSKLDI